MHSEEGTMPDDDAGKLCTCTHTWEEHTSEGECLVGDCRCTNFTEAGPDGLEEIEELDPDETEDE